MVMLQDVQPSKRKQSDMIHIIITHALAFGFGACIGGYIVSSIIEKKINKLLEVLDE